MGFPRIPVINNLDMFLPDARQTQDNAPAVVFQSTQTKPVPLVLFGGDFVIGPASNVILDITAEMGERCTGSLLVGVTGGVKYSVNNGKFRTAASSMEFNDCNIKQLQITTDAIGTCIVQLHGV